MGSDTSRKQFVREFVSRKQLGRARLLFLLGMFALLIVSDCPLLGGEGRLLHFNVWPASPALPGWFVPHLLCDRR